MIDMTALRPGDEIRHRDYREFRVRVIDVGDRVKGVLLSPPEQRDDTCSLDRGDVETLWEIAR